MSEISKEEIRKAIDRLQDEHPCYFTYDPTRMDSLESADVLKRAVDTVSQRMNEDSEIHVICEFAKLYLDGARPVIERPHGKWIDTGEAIGDDVEAKCSICGEELFWYANYCPNCGSRMEAHI